MTSPNWKQRRGVWRWSWRPWWVLNRWYVGFISGSMYKMFIDVLSFCSGVFHSLLSFTYLSLSFCFCLPQGNKHRQISDRLRDIQNKKTLQRTELDLSNQRKETRQQDIKDLHRQLEVCVSFLALLSYEKQLWPLWLLFCVTLLFSWESVHLCFLPLTHFLLPLMHFLSVRSSRGSCPIWLQSRRDWQRNWKTCLWITCLVSINITVILL